MVPTISPESKAALHRMTSVCGAHLGELAERLRLEGLLFTSGMVAAAHRAVLSAHDCIALVQTTEPPPTPAPPTPPTEGLDPLN